MEPLQFIIENIKNTSLRIETLCETQEKIQKEIKQHKIETKYLDKDIKFYRKQINEIEQLYEQLGNIERENDEDLERLNFLIKIYDFGMKHDFNNPNTIEILRSIIDIYKQNGNSFTRIKL
jgi:hypothetical protein